MLYTHTVIESRGGRVSAVLPVGAGLPGGADDINQRPNRVDAERKMDDVLADSFPASDPPSWNPGVSRPEPVVSMPATDDRPAAYSGNVSTASSRR